ncbi:hypothetical protein [Bartonella massiliensis]|uniref:hypothetical protein n=1 Tax=Bartonella massiliensis TaxID=929795 RepID=UPI00115C0CFB|nr:hypothetical protein [Bartonella massiliensis]
MAKYFGGGANYDGKKWTVPIFKLKTFKDDGTAGEEKQYDNVGSALAGIDGNFECLNDHLTNVVHQLSKEVTNIIQEVQGMPCYGIMIKMLLSPSMEKKGKSKIKYLLDGDISKGSIEAITGNQIYSLKNQFAAYFGGGAGYDKNGK